MLVYYIPSVVLLLSSSEPLSLTVFNVSPRCFTHGRFQVFPWDVLYSAELFLCQQLFLWRYLVSSSSHLSYPAVSVLFLCLFFFHSRCCHMLLKDDCLLHSTKDTEWGCMCELLSGSGNYIKAFNWITAKVNCCNEDLLRLCNQIFSSLPMVTIWDEPIGKPAFSSIFKPICQEILLPSFRCVQIPFNRAWNGFWLLKNEHGYAKKRDIKGLTEPRPSGLIPHLK